MSYLPKIKKYIQIRFGGKSTLKFIHFLFGKDIPAEIE